MEDTVAVAHGREEVFRNLRNRILNSSVARRLPRADAEDVTQDTILTLLKKYPDKPDVQLFYIGIAIAANKFKEWRRRQMRVAPLSGDSSSEDKRDQEEAGIRKPWKEGGTQNREENEAVRQLTFSELLAGLSSDCKQVILLHNEGKSDKEIQQELGLPSANAVAARRSYCLKHLFDVKRGIQR